MGPRSDNRCSSTRQVIQRFCEKLLAAPGLGCAWLRRHRFGGAWLNVPRPKDRCGPCAAADAAVRSPPFTRRSGTSSTIPGHPGRHYLAGRAGDPLRGHPAQGLGWQPDLGRCASAIRVDVGVANVPAAGALCPGLPQPIPAGHDRGPAPVSHLVPAYATRQALSSPPAC
jgi:hypothetical protein